ncbi:MULTISPECIES: hypothetical protein [Oceanobacillus]|uniref:hypothetical protein n=1 Tax=Oceanobacillus TaxID=182709 RepID=UPI000348E0F5|nr:hypothetical protein [Oceanobacillus kimchii]MBT2600200.1 hypothetical protein [Oceanobacillus sp. ISL-74]MBT2650358.1 hypothetical protein [Oceanobacillus sp. ISL-73]
MKIKIGVIGPADSVKQIMAVAKEFPNTEITPFTYNYLEEIHAIIQENDFRMDQWFFSGILNYSYAIEKKLVTNLNALYPNMSGSTFFGTLLEAQLENNQVYKRISMDTITNEEVEKIVSYYRLEGINYFNRPFQSYADQEERVEFHKELFEQGKIDIAITFIWETYNELKRNGIPVFRVTPSYLSIEQTFRILVERAKTSRYKNAQLAVIGCQVNMDTSIEDIHYSFRMKHKEIELRRTLLFISEKVHGSLLQIGDGLFLIFTTRGEIGPLSEEELLSVIHDVKEQENMELLITIGYGETVSQAEQHVRKGFHHQKVQHLPSIIIIDEDERITVKHGNDASVSYKTIELGESWRNKIKHTGVSPGVVHRIFSYSKQYNHREFTAQDLSRWLKGTDRNARRIITLLEKANIIEQCGEIQSGIRGRPRRVFCFKEDKELNKGGN